MSLSAAEIIEIQRKLQEMVDLDQAMRLSKDSTREDYDRVDGANTAQMKEWVDKYGWFTISQIGVDASSNAWLLIQHADRDPEFQERCLKLMLNLPSSEVNKKNVAYLTDRVLLAKGRPQLYGTQLVRKGSFALLRPVEDINNLDKRRSENGLPTIAEYLQSYARSAGIPAYLTEEEYEKASA